MTLTFDQWHESGQRFSWRDHDVFYQTMGQGPALLMIHGFPTSGYDYADMAEVLKQHFTLIIPDMLDYGQSHNRTKKRCTIFDQVDMMADLLGHLGHKECHVLAHDVGDTVAQEMIHRENAGSLAFTINSLVLQNGGLVVDHHRPRRIQKLLLGPFGPLIAQLTRKAKFSRSLAAIMGKNTSLSAQQFDDIWRSTIGINGKASLARRIHYMTERIENRDRWVKALQETKHQLLMINGTDDPISGGHACDAFETLFPNMTIIRMAGIGHFPPIEAPSLTTDHFLKHHHLI